MSKKHIMSYDEALSLLGLKRSTARSRKAIDAAYAKAHRKWTIILNAACTQEMRNRASAAITLVHEAKKICIEGLSSRPGSKSSTGSASCPRRSQPVPRSRGKVRNFFFAVWNILTAIINTIRILISSTGKFLSYLADVTRDLEAAGIPKAVTVLVFIVVILIVLNGCNQAFNSLTGALK